MELIPPREAEVEGVFRQPGSSHDGRIIYTETVVDVEATKASAKVKIGPDGQEVWKKAPGTGEPLYPILVKETKFKTIRYILNGQEVGRNVKKVYNFEMTDEERETLKRKEAERDFLTDFVQAAVAEGMTAGELLQQIKRQTLDGEAEDSVELDLTETVIAEKMAAEVSTDMIERPADEADLGPPKKGRKKK